MIPWSRFGSKFGLAKIIAPLRRTTLVGGPISLARDDARDLAPVRVAPVDPTVFGEAGDRLAGGGDDRPSRTGGEVPFEVEGRSRIEGDPAPTEASVETTVGEVARHRDPGLPRLQDEGGAA